MRTFGIDLLSLSGASGSITILSRRFTFLFAWFVAWLLTGPSGIAAPRNVALSLHGLKILQRYSPCEGALAEGTPSYPWLDEGAMIPDPTVLYELDLDFQGADRKLSGWRSVWRGLRQRMAGSPTRVKLYGFYVPESFVGRLENVFRANWQQRSDSEKLMLPRQRELRTWIRLLARRYAEPERRDGLGYFVLWDAEGAEDWASVELGLQIRSPSEASSLAVVSADVAVDVAKEVGTPLYAYLRSLGRYGAKPGSFGKGEGRFALLSVQALIGLGLDPGSFNRYDLLMPQRSEPWLASHGALMEFLFLPKPDEILARSDDRRLSQYVEALDQWLQPGARWVSPALERGARPLAGPYTMGHLRRGLNPYLPMGRQVVPVGLKLPSYLETDVGSPKWYEDMVEAARQVKAKVDDRVQGSQRLIKFFIKNLYEAENPSESFVDELVLTIRRSIQSWLSYEKWTLYVRNEQEGEQWPLEVIEAGIFENTELIEWFLSLPQWVRDAVWLSEVKSFDWEGTMIQIFIRGLESKIEVLTSINKNYRRGRRAWSTHMYTWAEPKTSIKLIEEFERILLHQLLQAGGLTRSESGANEELYPMRMVGFLPRYTRGGGVLANWERAFQYLMLLRRDAMPSSDDRAFDDGELQALARLRKKLEDLRAQGLISEAVWEKLYQEPQGGVSAVQY